VEEFTPNEILHIAGEKNCVADGLSRLDIDESDFDAIQLEVAQSRLEYCNFLQYCTDQNLFAFRDSNLVNAKRFLTANGCQGIPNQRRLAVMVEANSPSTSMTCL